MGLTGGVLDQGRRLVRRQLSWARSQPLVKWWLNELGIEQFGHSTLIWLVEDERWHTRVTMRNYFSLSYGIPRPVYRFQLFGPDGDRLGEWSCTARPDETLVIDSRQLSASLGLRPPFQGTLAAEVKDRRLDPPRFLRANVDYYDDMGFITTVHDQGRFTRRTRRDVQSLVYVREDDEFETSVVLHNWYRYRRDPREYVARATLELLNSRGASRTAPAPPIPACGMRVVKVRDLFPDAAAFLGGEAGGLRIHANIPMGRSIPILRSRRTGAFAVNHTTGDNDPTIYTRELLPSRPEEPGLWAPVWSSFVQENDRMSTTFSVFNNWLPRGTYSLDIRLFGADGGLVRTIPGIVSLGPGETRVLEMGRLLRGEGIPLPFSGSIEARIAPPQGQALLPAPGMLQVDTIWATPVNMSQSNNQSLWYANCGRGPAHYLSPRRTKMFGRVVADQDFETLVCLINPSSEESYKVAANVELTVTDGSGARRQTAHLRVPPHGSTWTLLEEVFPNLRDFLAESRGVSSILVIEPNVKLIGYLGVRHRLTGALGIDHLFGG